MRAQFVIPVLGLFAVLLTASVALSIPQTMAEESSPSITITNTTLDQTGLLQVNAEIANFTSTNQGWQIALIVYDEISMGESQVISFALDSQQNFEIINFGGFGMLLIENLTVDLDAGKIVIDAFSAGFEGQTTIGLMVQNDSDPSSIQSDIDYAYTDSQEDASPTCDTVHQLIELAIIPHEISAEFLEYGGC